jgi:hypothetical protein
MIEMRNAPVALLAVLGALQDMSFTYIAKVFIAIHVKAYDIISAHLSFSLKVDCNISRIRNSRLEGIKYH